MNNKRDILFSVQDLKVYFCTEDEVSRAVDGISFDIRREETVCLVGESGCGKTVTALTTMGLVSMPPGKIAEGRILFQDKNLLDFNDKEMQQLRGNRIAMIFQEPLTSLNPVFTIGDQIGEAIQKHEKKSEKEIIKRSIQLLKDVGMGSAEKRLRDYPHQLSGGQRQRVMIAMALACGPDLMIADEPTTALDVTVQAQILRLLYTIQKKRSMSVLYITHDLGVVSKVADRVCVMYAGIIAEQATRDDIFKKPKHPYTQALLDALPNRSKRDQRLYSIPGTVPNPAYKPGGCPFHPRCTHAIQICREKYPGMCDYGNGHLARCPVLFDDGRENWNE